MSDFTPSTEEVRTDYIMAYTERQSSQLLAGLAFDRWHQAELRRAKAEALRYMGRQFEIASEQGTGVRDMIAAQFCYDHAAGFEQEDDHD